MRVRESLAREARRLIAVVLRWYWSRRWDIMRLCGVGIILRAQQTTSALVLHTPCCSPSMMLHISSVGMPPAVCSDACRPRNQHEDFIRGPRCDDPFPGLPREYAGRLDRCIGASTHSPETHRLQLTGQRYPRSFFSSRFMAAQPGNGSHREQKY